MRPRAVFAAAALAGVLSACHILAGPEEVRRMGSIAGYNSDDPRVTLVQSGRRVDVSVISYGGGCERQGDTEVVVTGLDAMVTPFDFTDVDAQVCTQVLKSFDHRVSIEFPAAGTGTIRVRGLSPAWGVADTIVVTREVTLP